MPRAVCLVTNQETLGVVGWLVGSLSDVTVWHTLPKLSSAKEQRQDSF